MSTRAASGPAGPRGRSVIVLAGEDSNDCKIVAEILRSHIGSVRMVEVTDKVRLKSAATASTRAERVSTLVRKAKARALRARADMVGLVVHEDLDGVTDAAYETIRAALAAELRRQSPCDCAFALAAFESESWLLLFPDAFAHLQPQWKIAQPLRGRDTGLLPNPKESLQRALTTPRFRESDGPRVAEAARTQGLMATPHGRNRSYTDFIADLGNWTH